MRDIVTNDTSRGWQTFLGAVISIGILFLGWMAWSVWQQGIEQAGMRVQLTNIQLQLSGLNTMRQMAVSNSSLNDKQDAEIQALQDRVVRLEHQLDGRD